MAAKNYTEILALVNAGNQMGLSNTIKRDYGIPLDFTSVQPSFDDAVIYAATNTKAYVGQPLSVGGKLYIINDVAAEKKHVVDEKEYDNYLVEVGSATEGDGVTIDLDEGVLTLHGFESALTGYLPRKAEDGTLEWVPISAVVQGDGNKVTTLTSEDGSVTITKKTDTDESLVYDLSVEAYDDADVKERLDAVEAAIGVEAEGETEATGIYAKIDEALQAAKDYADAQDTDTVYDDTDVKERLDAIEEDYLKAADKYDDTAVKGRLDVIERDYLKIADKYNDTALAGRVTTLEQAVEAIDFVDTDELDAAIDEAVETINETLNTKAAQSDLEALEDRVDAFLTGTGATDALDSLQELIKYINEHDDVEISGILADIEAIEGKLAGVEGTVVDYVTGAINALKIGDYAKAADLTALAGRVEALEAKPFDTYATKTEVQDVDAKFADYTKTSDLTTQLAAKADADKVVSNDTFEQFQTSNTEAIGAARTGAVADVEAKGYAVATEVAGTYATKQDLTDHSNTMATTLNAYAKAEDVEADLAKKIDTATIEHTSEGVGEDVTVEGTSLKIVIDAYTKAETVAKINDVIDKINDNSETAASVAADLAEYEEANDARVALVETKNNEQDTAIAAAQAQADKGVADAKTANDAIAALTAGQVTTNKNDIDAVKTRLSTLETAKGDHETRIAAAEGKITSLETTTANNATAIGELQGKDAELVAEDARLAGLITALDTNKANAADVYTKGATDAAITAAIAAIPAVDFAPYLKSEDAAKTYATIAALEGIYKAGEGEAAATGILAEEIARAMAAEKQIADDLALLIENPTEALDSVKELITHVQNHGTAVEGIITRLDGHDDILAGIGGEGQPDTVIAAINAAVATVVQPKASKEVTVAEDGTLGLGEVSTDKLVQGTDTLVLNGGNAGVATAE